MALEFTAWPRGSVQRVHDYALRLVSADGYLGDHHVAHLREYARDWELHGFDDHEVEVFVDRVLSDPELRRVPRSAPRGGKARVHELAKKLGTTSREVMVRLTEQGVSVRSASSTVAAADVQRLLDSYGGPEATYPRKGQYRSGKVREVLDHGVFVDLDGVRGLIHSSELSWEPFDHPSDVVHVGQSIAVKVLDVDRSNHRVWLSHKRVDVDPWEVFSDEWVVGQLVPGTVTELRWNGALVRLGEGVEGAVDLANLSDRPVLAPDEVLCVGDYVAVRIIGIDVGGGITLRLESVDGDE